MDAKDITQDGWSKWIPWGMENIDLFPPYTCGMYIIRSVTSFARVKCKSDIAYIGINKLQRKDGLQGRITKHFHADTVAGKCLRRLIANGFRLELAYKCESEQGKRSVWEVNELQKYREEHLELPPANSSLPKLKSKL